MTLKAWPFAFLALLSIATTSGATVTQHAVSLRDPEIFQNDALVDLLSELSFDPDVRIAVANAGLRVLADRRTFQVETTSILSSRPTDLAALVAREGFNAGLDPSYLVRLANRESHFDPLAESPTSTAAGLFQFTDNTWLCSLREFGPGLGVVGSDQIWRTRRGVCETSPHSERSRLLALRSDPVVSTRIAAAFSLRNYRVLMAQFGHRPTGTELYVLHFLGENVGVRFLQTYRDYPNTSALSLSKAGAFANPEIFFNGSAGSRSVKEVFGALRL